MSNLKTLLLFFAALIFFPHFSQAKENSHHILVSVAPHKFFAEKIAGNTVSVDLMVPAGASSHTFEPTPKQMLAAAKADLWFCIGESFESRVVKALKAYNAGLSTIDLRQGLDMIATDPFSGCCCCHANSQDLHFWLSARQAKIQARTIATVLSERYPEYAEVYQERLETFLLELDDLDNQIEKILKPLANRLILVSHPAYAYFCRDYQLAQLSVEFEGKDPTPQQLHRLLIRARESRPKRVFIQAQYSSKGAKLIAKEIGAEVVMLDPYSENYLQAMLDIALAFVKN